MEKEIKRLNIVECYIMELRFGACIFKLYLLCFSTFVSWICDFATDFSRTVFTYLYPLGFSAAFSSLPSISVRSVA